MAVFIFNDTPNSVNSGSGSDRFELNGGNDTIFAGTGDDSILGGSGTDVAQFSGSASDYLGSFIGGTNYVIFGPDGYDSLNSVELIQFGSDAPIPITTFVNSSDGTDYPIATINNVGITEGDVGTKSLSFTVTLSKPAGSSGGTLMVSTITSGTAMPGTDFGSFSNQVVSFSPGSDTADDPVIVTVFSDSLFELNETVFVRLSEDTTPGATGQVIPSPNPGQGTINDQDQMPTVTITPSATTEGNAGTSGLNFTVTLSEAAGTTIPINVTTAADGTHTATVGVDYLAPGATVNIPSGQTSGTITVPIVGDQDVEDDETFAVVVTPFNPRDNVNVGSTEATGSINNDDEFLPTLSIADATILEGNNGITLLDFVVTLSEPWADQVTVVAITSNATASTIDQDYVETGAVITFTPGATVGHFTVPVIGDTKIEANETLTVALSNVTNARIGPDGTATGTIINDDQAGSGLSVTITSTSVSEGNSGLRTAVFSVDLSGAAPTEFSVDATTVNGTAIAGSDFQATTATIVIPAGQSHGEFVVTLLPDQIREGDETFTVTLSNPSGGVTIGEGTATGTILNDDQGTPVEINGLTIADDNGNHAWWGGAQGDDIQGSGGNDSLMGVGGSDAIDGGDGNDVLMGGALAAGDGADSLTGGAGNDTGIGGAGNDTILGGAGNDLLMGDSGDDTILGGNNDDRIFGGIGNDYLWGEAGNDTITGQGGNDMLVGGSGNDRLVTDGGNDTLSGGADADQLVYQGTGTADILITDFVPGTDAVLLDPRLGLTAEQADAQTVADGANAVLSFAGGGSITFVGLAADLGDLSAADFVVFA